MFSMGWDPNCFLFWIIPFTYNSPFADIIHLLPEVKKLVTRAEGPSELL